MSRLPVEHEYLGVTWFIVSRLYSNEREAAVAWERITAEGKRRPGELDLGVYRHGPEGGFPRHVTAVSRKRSGALVAARVLSGEPYDLQPAVAERMIARRVLVIADLLEQGRKEPSSVVIRRKRGARLLDHGVMEEQIGSDG